MDTIKGGCLHDRERLVTEDYLNLPLHKPRSRNARCVDILYVGIFITAVIACIVSCTCAIYCHKALFEIKELQHDTEHGIQEESVPPTRLQQFSELRYDVDTNSDENDNLDNSRDETEDFDDTDETDEEELEEPYYDDMDESQADMDVTVEGSGDLVRKRRATESSCETKCKRKRGEKRRKCLNRCNKGGNIKKTKQAINLPAAQFEVKFTDEEIQNKVKTEFNSFENKDTCRNIKELDGKLCLNRTYTPEKNDVPLNIFKAAKWVDDKSPVKFNNSVAKAKSAGIYLVYTQAYIGGKEPEKAIAVVQKRDGKDINAFSCRTGVHPDHYDSMSSQLQTCSVLSLINVVEGDTIEIQKSASTSDIILDKDKTYFGIVQLSGVVTPKSRKKKN